MFKNFGDIISGKRFRENKIAVYAQTEPLERFKASELVTLEVAPIFADALAMATWMIVSELVLGSKRPYTSALRKSLDSDALRRLSAFVAWWAVSMYINDARGLADIEAGADPAQEWQDLAAAASAVLNTMYPRDAASEEAIDSYILGEQNVESGGSIFYALAAIRIAIGEPPIEIRKGTLEDQFQDHASVSGTLLGYRNMLAETFAIFQRGDSSR